MEKFEVMIDVSGTIHLAFMASSHNEAYEKARKYFDSRKTISKEDLYEANFYVEDDHGLQLEFV